VTDEQVRQLAEAIHRHSVMGADVAGLSMTEQQLELLERLIVAKWVKRKLTDPYYDPTGTMIFIKHVIGD
jgi:hypothetical protein